MLEGDVLGRRARDVDEALRVPVHPVLGDVEAAQLVLLLHAQPDGLLDDDGLHRVATAPLPAEDASLSHGEVAALSDVPPEQQPGPRAAEPEPDQDLPSGEPILSADELKALLQEQPTMPPAGDESD